MWLCGESGFSVSVLLNLTIRKCSPSSHYCNPANRFSAKHTAGDSDGLKTEVKPPVLLGSKRAAEIQTIRQNSFMPQRKFCDVLYWLTVDIYPEVP